MDRARVFFASFRPANESNNNTSTHQTYSRETNSTTTNSNNNNNSENAQQQQQHQRPNSSSNSSNNNTSASSNTSNNNDNNSSSPASFISSILPPEIEAFFSGADPMSPGGIINSIFNSEIFNGMNNNDDNDNNRQQQRHQQRQAGNNPPTNSNNTANNTNPTFNAFFGSSNTNGIPFGIDPQNFIFQVHQQQQSNAIPPASQAAIRNLPIVTITKEDMIDPCNRQCSICFNEIEINQKVIRLIPYCGHTFCCADCIVPWLQKSGTCPICRYELPTDSTPEYEYNRKVRMSYRKPRLTLHDIRRLSIPQLKQLLLLDKYRKQYQQQQQQQQQHQNGSVSVRTESVSSPSQHHEDTLPHFYDKQEIVDYIVSCKDKYVDWIVAPPPVKYTVKQLQDMSISQLKHVMNDEAGVYFETKKDIVEKNDMLQYFILSGRLEIIPPSENDSNDEGEGKEETDNEVDKMKKNVVVETISHHDDDHCNNSPQHDKRYYKKRYVFDDREDQNILMEENSEYISNHNDDSQNDHAGADNDNHIVDEANALNSNQNNSSTNNNSSHDTENNNNNNNDDHSSNNNNSNSNNSGVNEN